MEGIFSSHSSICWGWVLGDGDKEFSTEPRPFGSLLLCMHPLTHQSSWLDLNLGLNNWQAKKKKPPWRKYNGWLNVLVVHCCHVCRQGGLRKVICSPVISHVCESEVNDGLFIIQQLSKHSIFAWIASLVRKFKTELGQRASLGSNFIRNGATAEKPQHLRKLRYIELSLTDAKPEVNYVSPTTPHSL